MTGPEHYRKAESLLDGSRDYRLAGSEDELRQAAQLAAEAHVHATLALAAATVNTARQLAHSQGWGEVIKESAS